MFGINMAYNTGQECHAFLETGRWGSTAESRFVGVFNCAENNFVRLKLIVTNSTRVQLLIDDAEVADITLASPGEIPVALGLYSKRSRPLNSSQGAITVTRIRVESL